MTTKGPSSDTLQLRRGTAAEWTAADPVLSAGEVGWERNTNKVKIGDGATAWTSLPYLAGTGVGADHGLLSGLGDDDHPQYAALAQDETVTGTWTFDEIVSAPFFAGDSTSDAMFKFRNDNLVLLLQKDELNWRNMALGTAYMYGESYVYSHFHVDGTLYFGSLNDTNLYRSAADQLRTDDDFFTGMPGNGLTWISSGNGIVHYYASETQPRFWITRDVNGANAGIQLGPGGSTAVDTNLYRSAADTLKTDDSLTVEGTLTADGYIRVSDATHFLGSNLNGVKFANFADSLFTLVIDNTGQVNFPVTGSNGGLVIGGDTNLYRAAVDILQTDDQFRVQRGVNAEVRVGVFTTHPEITFGTTSSQDTNLYRGAANRLQSDDALRLVGTGYYERVSPAYGGFFWTEVDGDTNARFSADTNGYLAWGPGSAPEDTTLYRGAANRLQTDDNFQVGGVFINLTGGSAGNGALYLGLTGEADPSFRVNGGGAILWGDGTAAPDVNLYRSAANTLKTDDNFTVGDNVRLNPTGGLALNLGGIASNPFSIATAGEANAKFYISETGTIQWGPGGATAADVNLYRLSANILKTDDGLDVLGPLRGVTMRAYGPGSQMAVFDNDFATDEAFLVGVSGDDFDRFAILAGGVVEWGSGAVARDVNLHRAAANQLQTDDSFLIAGSLYADSWQSYSGASPTVKSFGDIIQLTVKANATQTADLQEWQDSSGNQLSRITALGYFSTQGNLYLQADGTSMFFGASSDTNLYRSAANTLKTDDEFNVNDKIFLKTAGDIKFESTLKGGSDQIILQQDGTLLLQERAAPGAPLDTTANLYTVDSGSGKGQLIIRFPSGASQIIATEP